MSLTGADHAWRNAVARDSDADAAAYAARTAAADAAVLKQQLRDFPKPVPAPAAGDALLWALVSSDDEEPQPSDAASQGAAAMAAPPVRHYRAPPPPPQGLLPTEAEINAAAEAYVLWQERGVVEPPPAATTVAVSRTQWTAALRLAKQRLKEKAARDVEARPQPGGAARRSHAPRGAPTSR